MKLLHVSAYYWPADGGAEKTAQFRLQALAGLGHRVRVICSGDRPITLRAGVEVLRLPDPTSALPEAVGWADVVMTQLAWSDLAIEECRRQGVPVVLFIHSVEGYMPIGKGDAYEPDRLVTNSAYSKHRMLELWGQPSITIPPMIDLAETAVERTGDAVAMVNPVEKKGGNIFRKIARATPGRNFVVKSGWNHLRGGDGDFEPRSLQRFVDTFRSQLIMPREPDFSNVANVEYLGPEVTIQELYRKARLLLVPSAYEETFGRVVLEAMSNGIPVIAHDVGGLSVAMGGAGTLISDNEAIDEWQRAIDRYDDVATFNREASSCRERARLFARQQETHVLNLECALLELVERR